MSTQLFMSHTKRDSDFCDRFDTIAARIGVRVFRSEFEEIPAPAWQTIKTQIQNSSALFLLVGKELVKAQELADTSFDAREDWKHTQNWISYEVGLACMNNIDVWVVCDDISINFPVPYLNNYEIFGIKNLEFRKWYRQILENYSKNIPHPLGKYSELVYECQWEGCGAVFNFWSSLIPGSMIKCPTCLRDITFKDGWAKSRRVS